MNYNILNQYGIEFFKHEDGVDVQSTSHRNLAIYIYIYRNTELVTLLLNDIDLALNGQYDQIEDPDWGRELGTYTYFGIIHSNMTFEIFYENDLSDVQTYPLSDIKEIFTSWLEFLES